MKVLIIEDSPAIIETISLAIEMRWPEAKIASTSLGKQGIEIAESEAPNVIILDLGLPDTNGFDVLKRIRLFSKVPILILSVNASEADIVKGLEWGADDYMTKPFKQLELLARLKGIMRRSSHVVEDALVYGQLRFEPDSRRLMSGSREIKISRTEGIILSCLMRNAGNVVSYSRLAEAMWGGDFSEAIDSIKVHIRHLREKLEVDSSKPQLILTKTGIGYYLIQHSGDK